MLSPQSLDRASQGFRYGYKDGYYGKPCREFASGSFAAFDYAEGRKAGENDRKWDDKLKGR
jgi:hypothetical protein